MPFGRVAIALRSDMRLRLSSGSSAMTNTLSKNASDASDRLAAADSRSPTLASAPTFSLAATYA